MDAVIELSNLEHQQDSKLIKFELALHVKACDTSSWLKLTNRIDF